jgi:hypothetical protein
MKKFLRSSLVAALALLIFGEPSAYAGGIAGDLTLTVEEQENGDIRFTLTGSSPIKNSGSPYYTPYGYDSSIGRLIPTATRDDSFTSFPLPPGLVLQSDGVPTSETDDGEIGEGLSFVALPIEEIHFFSGGWVLSVTSGGVISGYTVQGEGSCLLTVGPSDGSEVEEIPPAKPIEFSDFVPGTYPVEGTYYDMTYVVVPYSEVVPISVPQPTAAPAIALRGRGVFPSTRVGSTSAPRTIRIRNAGKAPLRGLRASVQGSREFSVSAPRPASLSPGASASVKVRFRPSASGRRSARLVVSGNAPSASISLVGRGVAVPVRAPLRPFK